LVTDPVFTAGQAVHTEASTQNAILAHDPALFRNGGTMISVEEQKPFQAIHRRLVIP
jgi:hypothetical protein